MTRRNPSNFDGVGEFTTDTIRVFRGWEVDELGRLEAVTRHTTWTPGINKAKCATLAGGIKMRLTLEHMAACQCGFYGLFAWDDRWRGMSAYLNAKRYVTGIVEFSGSIVVGTEGARASQAEIVALVADRPTRYEVWVDRMTSRFRGSEPLQAIQVMMLIFGFIGLIVGVALWTTGTPPVGVPLVGGAVVVLSVWLSLVCSEGAVKDRRHYDRFKTLYPDVKMYRSARAAVRAHPLYRLEATWSMSPEDTDDFWKVKV